MTFLPILDRELRVAARDRRTYWSRCYALGLAMMLGLWLMPSSRWMAPAAFGRQLFSFMTWTAFIVSMLAGLMVTSDAISREKRDGTLGLLFLTDLKPLDIAMGKLLATSLNVFYGLVAILPALMISLLFGGITAGEVARVSLSLILGLVFALMAGLLGSVICEKASTAFSVGFLLLTATMAFEPLLAYTWWQGVYDRDPPAWLMALNPAMSLVMAPDDEYQAEPWVYWTSCAYAVLLMVVLFILLHRLLQRAWREQPASATRLKWRERLRQWMLGGQAWRTRSRRRWLEPNPMLWLAMRERLKPWFAWIPLLFVFGLCLFGWFYDHKYRDEMMRTPFTVLASAFLLNLVYKIFVASEAAQVYPEDRRTGALEALAGTSLTVREMVMGRWHALCHYYTPPVAVALIFEWVMLVRCDFSHSPRQETFEIYAAAAAGTLVFLSDLVSLAWAGLWAGLASSQAVRARLVVTLNILLLPWLVFIFTGSLWRWHGDGELALVVYAVWCLLFSLPYWWWARMNLLKNFRILAVNPQWRKAREYRAELRLLQGSKL